MSGGGGLALEGKRLWGSIAPTQSKNCSTVPDEVIDAGKSCVSEYVIGTVKKTLDIAFTSCTSTLIFLVLIFLKSTPRDEVECRDFLFISRYYVFRGLLLYSTHTRQNEIYLFYTSILLFFYCFSR